MLPKYYQFIIVVVCFFYLYDATAQEDKDSLDYYKLQIKTAKSKSSSADTIIFLYNKAKQFSGRVDKVILTRREALYLGNQGHKDLSLSKYKTAISMAHENELRALKGLIYIDLSNYYYNFHQTKLAYITLLKAKVILENLTTDDIILYNSTADSKVTQEQMLDPVVNNLGVMALDNGEYDKAERHYNESYKFAVKRNDKQGVLDAKINLANLLLEKDENEKSNLAFFKILKDSISLKSDLLLIYYNIAANFLELKDFDKSLKYIDKSIIINNELGKEIYLADLFLLKAKILKHKSEPSKAKVFLEKSIQKSLEIDDFSFLLELYKEMVEIENDNPENANSYYKKILAVQDSIEAQEQYGSYEEILLENKLYNQEQINTKHKKNIIEAKERISLYVKLILLGIFSFVSLGLLFYLYRENNKKTTDLIKQKTKIKAFELENKRKSEAYEIERIQDELKAKKRELLSVLLFTKKRKEKLKIITKKIDQIGENSIITKDHLEAIKQFIVEKSKELDVAENVQQLIVKTHKGFFNELLKDHTSLTQTELKVLAYLRVGMNSKEIANVQNVSIDAVRKMRYRIRKKLKLEPKQSLEKFILQYH